MAGKLCGECSFRKKYEQDPHSLLGRLWRWHTGWCPGWKSFMAALPPKERTMLNEQLLELDHRRTYK